MMKKILYIEGNTDGTIGGSYYSLLYLIQGLNKHKYEPHVMFYQDNDLIHEYKKVVKSLHTIKEDYLSGSMRAGIIKWPYHLLRDVILKQYKLRKIINEIQPDIVHLNNCYSGGHEWMLACYLNKIKIVSHDRAVPHPCSFRTKLFVRFLDAIITVSDNNKNQVIAQNLKARRIRRVYNGLDPNTFNRAIDPLTVDTLKTEFKIQNNQPVVGIIGNIQNWKGQLVVVKAMEIVVQEYPDVKCLIVGKTSIGAERYEREIREYILNNNLVNNVVVAGFRKDILQILSIMDVFIHASIKPEPFSRAILEGMAIGKPIVATNSGGTPEQIINGETGLLVPMNNPGKMAEAVIYFLSDMKRAEEMGMKGRQRLLELFSIKRMVKETESIYENIFT